MTLLFTYFLLAIVVSFLCSIWEATLLSMTPSYIRNQTLKDAKVGAIMEGFKKDIDRPLSAILTLNTLAHTVGAMGVGAQAGKLYGTSSFNLFGFELTYESLIAGVMTLAILFLSEIIPKTLGANNWRALGVFTTRSVNIIIYLLYPIVQLCQLITKGLKNNKDESVLSRSDFSAMADIVEESGEINDSEYTMIKNLLEMEHLTARDVMTPRILIHMEDGQQTLRQYYDKDKNIHFSRIPIYAENKDDVTGIVLKDDLLSNLVEGENDKSLQAIAHDPLFVSDKIVLPNLFDKMMEKKIQMAMVMDEFGHLVGLVTLEDIIETIFGQEILDEKDQITDLQAYARKKWEERVKKIGLIE